MPEFARFRKTDGATEPLSEILTFSYRRIEDGVVRSLAFGHLSIVTLKQHIHELVVELPDDSPILVEVNETLRLNQAIGEAMDDSREGRTIETHDFLKRLEERWPKNNSE